MTTITQLEGVVAELLAYVEDRHDVDCTGDPPRFVSNAWGEPLRMLGGIEALIRQLKHETAAGAREAAEAPRCECVRAECGHTALGNGRCLITRAEAPGNWNDARGICGACDADAADAGAREAGCGGGGVTGETAGTGSRGSGSALTPESLPKGAQ